MDDEIGEDTEVNVDEVENNEDEVMNGVNGAQPAASDLDDDLDLEKVYRGLPFEFGGSFKVALFGLSSFSCQQRAFFWS